MEMNEILGWIGLAILLGLAVWLIIGYVRDTGDWATGRLSDLLCCISWAWR